MKEAVDILNHKPRVNDMKNLMLFLRESNAIENVWDELSLTYARAAWDYLIKKKKLTVKTILRTHAILMHDKLDPEETGAYRKRPVYIGGHEAKKWYVIPDLMDQWYKTANGTIKLAETGFRGSGVNSIEEMIKDDHIAFEAIHPFQDGNGRMGRLIMNWQRDKLDLPILVIKEVEKHSYYAWFEH